MTVDAKLYLIIIDEKGEKILKETLSPKNRAALP